MTPAGKDILAFRRGLAAGWAVRVGLFLLFVAGASVTSLKLGHPLLGSGLMAASGSVYLWLTFRSLRVSRDALAAPELMARGEFTAAERVLRSALRTFSLFPAQRVVELHHLAVLRHGQRRYEEAAELARAVLKTKSPSLAVGGVAGPGGASALQSASRLVGLESMLETGDLRGAHLMLGSLMAMPLSPADAVRVTAARVRYEAAVALATPAPTTRADSGWNYLLVSLPEKLAAADLMPPGPYANTHALLAVAARKTARPDLGRWLLARALAVCEPQDLPALSPELARAAPDLADWIAEETALNLTPDRPVTPFAG